ncbi:MAG TPA: hypothetical protein VFQ82_05345, partial [Stellaceae bacterium]|nr:hypothetical protein [Stellaceae bacterium]
MAGTTYHGTYVNGIVLSNPATQNPATIAATGYVSKNGFALVGARGTAWTVSNLGTINGNGTLGVGIDLEGGAVTN